MKLGRILLALSLVAAATVAGPVGKADAARWATFGTDCTTIRKADWTATGCYQVAVLENDTNKREDYFQIQRTVIAHSLGQRRMGWFWASVTPSVNSHAQRWQGADPFEPQETRSSKHDCRSTSFSVSGGSPISVGFSQSVELCNKEKLMPELSTQAGRHAARWSAERGVDASEVRKAMVLVNVRVAEDGWARWTLNTPNVVTD